MDYLLDTNILIDWFTGGPSQGALEAHLQEPDCRLGTAWICATEFLVKATREEASMLHELVACGDLALHELQGLESAVLVGNYRHRSGLPLPDCMILATAARADATLITRDRELHKSGRRCYKRIEWVE